ncbi:MAG: hypothetical protein R3F03_15395 [Opitutaceae bacterium]
MVQQPHGLPTELRRVLHRAEHQLIDSGDAAWQAGRHSVRAAPAGYALRDLWPTRAPGRLLQSTADE